jgi:hypothetical protein
MAGRPSKYSEEIADHICEIISTSNRSIASISKELNISTVTIFYWLKTKPEFLNEYARAKEWQADFLAEEILEIADDTQHDSIITQNGLSENHEYISRSRLRVDSRKWLASKLKPQKYGDSQKIEHSGDIKIKHVFKIAGQTIEF